MSKKRVVVEFGMGTSIRSENYTEAASRAIRDALWRNSLNVATFFGFPKEAMIIEAEIGIQNPDAVDRTALLKLFPYGQVSVTIVKGGLNVPRRDAAGFTVIAHAAIVVSFDMEPANA